VCVMGEGAEGKNFLDDSTLYIDIYIFGIWQSTFSFMNVTDIQ
jgi:hypothetical protein